MRKQVELDNASSCLNKAGKEEYIFILLSRDESSPETIRFWCRDRIFRGKNKRTDGQIQEALQAANIMEMEGSLYKNKD